MNKIINSLRRLSLWHWSLIIFFLNVLFRLPSLFGGELWLDESISVFHCQQSWADIYAFSTNEPNPPLFYFLLGGWIKLFGISEPAVRSLPLLFMSLAGVYTFRSLYKLGFIKLSFISAFFFLTSNRLMWYTNEVRTYSLVAFLAAFSTYYFILFIKGNSNKTRNGVFLTLAYAAMLTSHYFSFWIPLLHFAFFVFYAKKEHYKAFGLVILGSLILFSPFIGFALYHTPNMEGSWLGSPNIKDLFNVTTRLVSLNKANFIYILSFVVIGAASMFFKDTPKAEKRLLIWMFFGGLGVLVFTFLISQLTPVFRGRYIVYSAIPWLIISSYGFYKIFGKLNKPLKIIFIAVIGLLQVYQLNFTLSKGEPFNQIVETVKAERNSDEKVIIYPWYYWKPFSYYYNQEMFKDYPNTLSALESDNIIPKWKTERIRDYFQEPKILILYRIGFGIDEILPGLKKVWPNHSITPLGDDIFLFKGSRNNAKQNE